MRRILRPVLTAAAVLAACSCGGRTAVDWRNHATFRAENKEIRRAHYEDKELATTKIRANLDYVAISLDSVFFRNLPGMGNSEVAFGLELHGIKGDGKPIKTVLDVRKGVGPNSFLPFDNLLAIEPFLYKGENVTISLIFQAIPDGKPAESVRATVASNKSVLSRLKPTVSHAIEMASDIFGKIMNALVWQKMDWKYGVTFFPADRIYRDKPDLLFTAGRYILIAIPPADSKGFEHITPNKLVNRLKLQGNRLVDKGTEEEYFDTPYIVLNITRFKRYPPGDDQELGKAIKVLEEHIENQNWEMASSAIVQLPAIITRDPIITTREKNFYRTRKEIYEVFVDMGQKKKANDGPGEAAAVMRAVSKTFDLSVEFDDILEPHEYQTYAFQVNSWLKRLDDLIKDNASLAEDLKKLKEKVQPLLKKGAGKPTADTPHFFVPFRFAKN